MAVLPAGTSQAGVELPNEGLGRLYRQRFERTRGTQKPKGDVVGVEQIPAQVSMPGAADVRFRLVYGTGPEEAYGQCC